MDWLLVHFLLFCWFILEWWVWVITTFFLNTYWVPRIVLLWVQRWTWPQPCPQRTCHVEGKTGTLRVNHDAVLSVVMLHFSGKRRVGVLKEPAEGKRLLWEETDFWKVIFAFRDICFKRESFGKEVKKKLEMGRPKLWKGRGAGMETRII